MPRPPRFRIYGIGAL